MKTSLILITTLTLTLATAIGCGDSSSDGGDDGAPGSGGSDRTDAIAEALTSSIDFPGGKVNDGPIPLATEEDVDVTSEDGTLELAAAETSVMSMDVDNPKEDEDPVAAVLVQFEDADEHVEVEAMLDAGYFESDFTMGDGVCDELCDEIHEVTMHVAVKLEGGGISPKHERAMLLDCTDTGDPGACEDDGGSGSVQPAEDFTTDDYKAATDNLLVRLCGCADPGCESTSDLQRCAGSAVDDHDAEFTAKMLACMLGRTKLVSDCLEDSAGACGGCNEATLGATLEEECGPLPEGLSSDLVACAEAAGLATGVFDAPAASEPADPAP